MEEIDEFEGVLFATCSPPGLPDCAVVQVGQYIQAGDVWAAYTGLSGVPFPVVPTDSYLIQLSRTSRAGCRWPIGARTHVPLRHVFFRTGNRPGAVSGASKLR